MFSTVSRIQYLGDEVTLRTPVEPSANHVVTAPPMDDVTGREDASNKVIVISAGLRVGLLELIKGVESNRRTMLLGLGHARALGFSAEAVIWIERDLHYVDRRPELSLHAWQAEAVRRHRDKVADFRPANGVYDRWEIRVQKRLAPEEADELGVVAAGQHLEIPVDGRRIDKGLRNYRGQVTTTPAREVAVFRDVYLTAAVQDAAIDDSVPIS